MKVTTIWIVRDPGPNSELVDVCWEVSVGQRLAHYYIGRGRVWKAEHHALYTTREEAEADAHARLAARDARTGGA